MAVRRRVFCTFTIACAQGWPETMVSDENAYTRFVKLAKILLPLAAIGLLSTLFMFSRQIDPSASLPYAQVDVEQMARDQQITAPSYAGVTRDGTQITLSAASAQPDTDDPSGASAVDLTARLDFTDGSSAEIRSDRGRIDGIAGEARLVGDVRINTSDGYRISADQMTSSLEHTELVAQGNVQAESPIGFVSAQEMQITGENGNGHVLVFKQGVKLVYQPGN